MDPADVAAYEQAVAGARAGLSEAFARAWSLGESMTADGIAAFI